MHLLRPLKSLPKHSKIAFQHFLKALPLFFLVNPLSGIAQTSLNINNLVFTPSFISVSYQEGTQALNIIEPIPFLGSNLIQPDSAIINENNQDNSEITLADFSDQEIELALNQFESDVINLESEGGAYNEALSQSLSSLSRLHVRAQNIEQALQTIDRALHINRVNHGLHNLNQVPIVQQKFQTYLADNNIIAADQLQEYILFLYSKNYTTNHPQYIAALEDYADWSVSSFLTTLEQLGTSGLSSLPFDNFSQLENFLINKLINANNQYTTISDFLFNIESPNKDQVLRVEQSIVRVNFLFSTHFQLATFTSSDIPFSYTKIGYRNGRNALQRQVNFLQQQEQPSATRISNALVELGDWNLLFKKRKMAVDQYAKANQLLLNNNAQDEQLKQLFFPDIPVSLPLFVFNEPISNSKGYIDVQFSLGKSGLPNSLQIIGSSQEATPQVQSYLTDRIMDMRFRPHFINGELVARDKVQLRYYYTY